MTYNWLLLILSLPTENATVRQRAWRALKASGAAVLRDGVYLLPESVACRALLDEIADQVRSAGGSAHLLHAGEGQVGGFAVLFDRSNEYALLDEEIIAARQPTPGLIRSDALRQVRRLRKAFDLLAGVDFFPGEARERTGHALRELELHIGRAGTKDEPARPSASIHPCSPGDFQQRVWATRRRPWVDRLASAWLIRRFIDRKAHFLWLESPADCPADAVGFDFDGATFTHAADLVTFEVLVRSFALEEAGLAHIGRLVHHLDVGGSEPPEAAGIESLLTGLRETCDGDDALLEAACGVFDALFASYQRGQRAR